MRKTKRSFPTWCLMTCWGLATLPVGARAAVADSVRIGVEPLPPVQSFNPYEGLRWVRQDGRAGVKSTAAQRPLRVNNAERIYFPPIFQQEHASCTAAARIAYMFTYEMNAARRLDASVEKNQYPTHYNWLHYYQNTDYPSVLKDHGVPDAVTYGGRTFSKDFGSDQNWYSNDYGWMQGYDKWYAAMFNRIERAAMFPQNVRTEEGREAVKQWLWNHQGDNSFDAGGVCTIAIGFVQGYSTSTVPDTETNRSLGVVGDGYVASWGVQIDHEMAVVGYDDRIEFDLDGNGVAGEKDKDEVGAWIVANSWGPTWDGNGLIYCPYKTAVCLGTDGNGNPDMYGVGYWNPEVYYVTPDYRPLRTMKVSVDFSKRSEISLVAGVSSDTSATEPEKSVAMEYFKFAGNGMKLDDNIYPDAETPMLGRWADGKLHDEPMELGYDLTALTTGYDLRKPLKYFFVIDSKKSAVGEGHVNALSVIDYEFDAYGIETKAELPADGVKIENQGGKTIVSVIVGGESFNAPRNVMAESNVLTWDQPSPSGYALQGYRLYADGSLVASLNGNQKQYDLSSLTEEQKNGALSLVALYQLNGKEVESSRIPVTVAPEAATAAANKVRNFLNSSFTVPDVFNSKYNTLTMEFWLKPTSLANYNQQIGPGWGKFLFHSSADKNITAGWTINSRVSTSAGSLKVNTWQHVALVINGNRLTVYIDGKEAATLTNNQAVGIGGFGDMVFGSNNNLMNGRMDELRIWSTARTQQQIQDCMNVSFARPEFQTGLLAYYKMDSYVQDNVVYLFDSAGGHHARVSKGSTIPLEDATLALEQNAIKADFDFSLPQVYVGQEVVAKSTDAPGAVRWQWTTAGTQGADFSLPEAKLVFDKAGEQEVTLTVFDAAGNQNQATRKIQVLPMPQPDATFAASETEVPATDRVVFTPKQDLAVNTYEWSIPGCSPEKIYTRQASVSFPKEGKYTVTLKVTNPQGSDTYSMEVTAMSSAPKTAFAVAPDIVVKGEKVFLEDRTEYSPNQWQWELVNGDYRLLVHGQNTSFVAKETGIYDITLSTSNAMGSDKLTKVKALTICNADGKQGLRFYGDQARVVYQSPMTESESFTIGWWMYPNTLQIKGNGIGNTEKDFLMYTEADGSMHLYTADGHVQSPAGYMLSGSWHHYAVTFQYGSVSFYRDGKQVGQSQNLPTAKIAFGDNFILGGSSAPFYGVIDELQVWKKALTVDQIRQYANAPIWPDQEARPEVGEIAATVSEAKEAGLVLYSPFNQNSGDVQDLSGNGNTGRREGFGPDGDAWSSAKGIFWLNFNERQVEDISDQYLTNYKAPFLHAETPFYTDPIAQYQNYELETETDKSGWVLENIAQGSVPTGFHVTDKEYNYNMVVEAGRGFAQEIPNHKVYQTIELPAGFYQFSVDFGPYYKFLTSYLVVNKGEGLPDVDHLDEALVYDDIANGKVAFQLSEPATVSLGVLVDWRDPSNWGSGTISRFTLSEIPYDEIESNGETTGLETVTPQTKDIQVRVVRGGLYLSSDEPQMVTIHTVAGTQVFGGKVVGTRPVLLKSGIYIVNKMKVFVP